MYLFVSLLVIINFFIVFFFNAGFSLNLIHESNCENFRTRRGQVVEWIIHVGSLFLEKQSLSLFRGREIEGVISQIF